MHVNIGRSGVPRADCSLPVTSRSKKVSAAQFREFCLEGDIAGARRFKGCVDTRELRGEYGDTGLILALKAGEEDLVKVLVEEMGADVLRCSRKGDSPLSVAAELRDTEMVQYFLDKGADPNQPSAVNAAIGALCRVPHDPREEREEATATVGEMIRILVDNGAVLPLGTGNYGRSTIVNAPKMALWPDLIRAGGDPNSTHPGEYTKWDKRPDWMQTSRPLHKICRVCWSAGLELDLFRPNIAFRNNGWESHNNGKRQAFLLEHAKLPGG